MVTDSDNNGKHSEGNLMASTEIAYCEWISKNFAKHIQIRYLWRQILLAL